MVICKYFLRGSCRFGETCKNEHAYNNENSGSVLRKKQDIEPSVLIKSVSNDMDKAEKGNQWPLSCYGPFQGKICFPGFEDKCFEEIRLGMYEAERNGTVEQYKQQLTLLLQEARMKIRSLQNPTPEAMNMLKDLFNSNSSETNTQSNSVFANNAANNQTNSIFANTAGKPAGQSIFATQPTTAASAAKNFSFALPENKSIFGNTNNPANTGSIFAQPSFHGAGASIFANTQPQQPATFPGAFQNNQSVFPTTNPPPFGAPNQTVSNSPFGQQSQGQNNSPFAVANQAANSLPFAAQNQSPFGQQNAGNNSPFVSQQSQASSNSPFASQQSQASSNSPFSQQQSQAPSNSPFASQQQSQASSNSPFSQQQSQTASNSPFAPQPSQIASNPQFTSQNQPTGNSPFAVPANQSPFSQSQVPANQSPFAPQNQTPAPSNQSIFTNQNQTPGNPPPFGANIFSNTQATITAGQGSLFQQATSTMNPPATENKSIFAQQPTAVTGGSIFGNTVQPQTTGQPLQNQVTPLDHTRNIFGTVQTNTAVKRQDDATVYSKIETLTDTERSCYEANAFKFGGIPEKPPTLQLCS